MRLLALLACALLCACGTVGTQAPNNPHPKVMLGIAAAGGYAGFAAAEKAIGAPCCAIDGDHYHVFDDPDPFGQEALDIKNGIIPQISVSAGLKAGGCLILSKVATGAYNNLIDVLAAKLMALGDDVAWVRLLYEGYSTEADQCSQPEGNDYAVQKAAFQYIVARLRADGLKARVGGWTPGEADFGRGSGPYGDAPLAYPGNAYAAYAGSDAYDKGGAPDFAAGMCKYGPTLGIPWGITEMGAPAADQVQFLTSLAANCKPAFVIYWDKPGKVDYTLAPATYAAFKAVGQ